MTPVAEILAELHRGRTERIAELEDLEVPPLPAVASRVLQLATDPAADARALAQLVERDPGLASTVLRVVRSPLWAGSVPIQTLPQAVARLGLRPLTEIVVAASLRPAKSGPNGAAIATTWRHAVATASFARRVSVVRRKQVASAYLCGLLHSVGKLILLRLGAHIDAGTLATQHPAVGLVAARRWGIPEAVAHAIAHHLTWQRAPAFADEAATTWLAARLAQDPNLPGLEQDPVLGALGLNEDGLAVLRLQVDGVKSDVAGLA